jgi:hypothetical protein
MLLFLSFGEFFLQMNLASNLTVGYSTSQEIENGLKYNNFKLIS